MEDTSVKVSIIIPVYNVEKYLVQCMESVLKQTLKEVEIICIDDGSTDRSFEILKHYEAEDPRIKVYSKSNAGYGHTINYGLDRSRGKYISIVESDDFIDERGIESLYNCAEMNEVDYVRSNYYVFSKGKDYLDDSLKRYSYNKVLSHAEDLSLFLSMPCQPWGCVYKRDFLYKNNIRMNETPGASYQDTSWTFIVLLKAERIIFLSSAFYHYRIDDMNSSINSQKKVFCLMDEKKYIEKKLEEYQISNPNILGIFSRFVYESYKINYDRVAAEYQYAFLLEWKKELLKQSAEGLLKKEYFENTQWKEIDSIINNFEDYFEKTSKAYAIKEVYAKTVNDEIYFDAFSEKIFHNEIIIFGTGVVAKELVSYLQEKGVLENIICFCETSPKKEIFYGKKVFSINHFPYSKHKLLICAALEKTQKSVIKELVNTGFSNILSLDERLRQKLRK